MVSSRTDLFVSQMQSLLDRWDEKPFSRQATIALGEAVRLQLTYNLGPPGEARTIRERLAQKLVELRHGAAREGAVIGGGRRSCADCKEALAALLVPPVGGTGRKGLEPAKGGRPPDWEYIDAVWWGFTEGRRKLSKALGRRVSDEEVARWLAEKWLPEFDAKRKRPRKTHEARSVLRAWQRIKGREKQTLAMFTESSGESAPSGRPRTSRRRA